MEEKIKRVEEKLLIQEQKEINSQQLKNGTFSSEFKMDNVNNFPRSLEQFQQTLEENLANVESKTQTLLQEMKEENKTLMEKMLYLEENLRVKSENVFRKSLEDRTDFDKGGDNGSVLIHDFSAHYCTEREGDKNIEEELYELKRRVEDSDEKMMNNFIAMENQIKLTAMNIIKEVNQKLLGIENPSSLQDDIYYPKNQSYLYSEDRRTQSTSNISPLKSNKSKCEGFLISLKVNSAGQKQALFMLNLRQQ